MLCAHREILFDKLRGGQIADDRNPFFNLTYNQTQAQLKAQAMREAREQELQFPARLPYDQYGDLAYSWDEPTFVYDNVEYDKTTGFPMYYMDKRVKQDDFIRDGERVAQKLRLLDETSGDTRPYEESCT